ncbi:MAG: LLM class flavin-dependent oxidoreductase [Acidimicrobiia bacterium]|nr:LLM class flavin-dependent oxidoreductase [Acidimicrobiia bacterium]
MAEPKRLLFNAFSMNCVSHIHHGLWGRAETRQLDYTSLDAWTELAQILEAGCFDALFLADVVGVYDNYKGGPETSIREAMQIPVNDPTLLIPAMAQVTEHLGFAFTGSILADHPFNFARRVSTLDHLTRGRVAWNIVTSYLPSAARNLGYADLPRHDDRYDRGDDYLDVLYKLWEASWEDDAVVADAERGIYAEPSKVHAIDHHGPYYQVPGPHLCEPSPQRTPVLFQAGSSDRGREFAARHAECMFVAGSSRAVGRIRADVHRRAIAYGRQPSDIKIFQGITPVVGGTEAEAKAKAEELRAEASVEGGLAHMSGNIGADLGTIDPERPIADVDFNRVTGIIKNLAETAPDRAWTFGDLARRQMTGQFLVGSPEQVADRLEKLAEAGADGFNLIYTSTPGTFVDFIDVVVPILCQRGLMQRDYRPGTLREKLFGHPRLSERHPGSAVRQR